MIPLPKLFGNKQLIYFTVDFGFLAIPVYTRECLPNKNIVVHRLFSRDVKIFVSAKLET